jgi:LPXTG-motif cell wall-anchored protein
MTGFVSTPPIPSENFATAPTTPITITADVELTNFYWTLITPVEAEVIITPVSNSIPETLSIAGTGDTRTLEEAGLTESFVGNEGQVINAPLSGFPAALTGDTINFSYTYELPAATTHYINQAGNLASYGYEYEIRLWLEGTATNGQLFTFPHTIAVKEVAPVFNNILTGEEENCPDLIANGQACVGTTAYGLGMRTASLPYPPLADDTGTPPTGNIPTAPVCEITNITLDNGQITVDTQFDIYAEDNGADAPYGFPSVDVSNPDVSPVYVFSANLEDNTGNTTWTETELFTEPVDWRTTNQEVRQGSFPVPAFPEAPNLTEARFFEGIAIPFTFTTDSTTPVEDRNLTLTFEVVFPQSGEGALPTAVCSTGEAITPPPADPTEPRLPTTGSNNTLLAAVALFGLLLTIAGTVLIVRARKVA